MFCVRMMGAAALGSKSTSALVLRQMLVSMTGAAMCGSRRLTNSVMSFNFAGS